MHHFKGTMRRTPRRKLGQQRSGKMRRGWRGRQCRRRCQWQRTIVRTCMRCPHACPILPHTVTGSQECRTSCLPPRRSPVLTHCTHISANPEQAKWAACPESPSCGQTWASVPCGHSSGRPWLLGNATCCIGPCTTASPNDRPSYPALGNTNY